MKEFQIQDNEAGQRFDKYLCQTSSECSEKLFLQNAPQKKYHTEW